MLHVTPFPKDRTQLDLFDKYDDPLAASQVTVSSLVKNRVWFVAIRNFMEGFKRKGATHWVSEVRYAGEMLPTLNEHAWWEDEGLYADMTGWRMFMTYDIPEMEKGNCCGAMYLRLPELAVGLQRLMDYHPGDYGLIADDSGNIEEFDYGEPIVQYAIFGRIAYPEETDL